MSAQKLSDRVRTWIEIDRRAIRQNVAAFRRLIGQKVHPPKFSSGKLGRVKLWSVVKSNAYGHGLYAFVPEADKAGVDGFCIDSLVEGLALRKSGIKKPMLVLGPTLSKLLPQAASTNVAVGVSTFEALKALMAQKRPPKFHLKFDTGMHRQGFSTNDLSRLLKILAAKGKGQTARKLEGIFTHFAAAKDLLYPTYTERQFRNFELVMNVLERAGYRRLIRHASATGGTILSNRYHLDAVRVGIGLYGLWPSRELELECAETMPLEPALSWRTVVTEVKTLLPGDYVGYDLTERVSRKTTAAILPIGYWHGFPRALSSLGEVLIRGKRAKVLGRVSMDLVVVDATAAHPQIGDTATLIGWDRKEYISADVAALAAGTTNYEFVTRLNPLIERVIVGK